jgi:hypothetical protein
VVLGTHFPTFLLLQDLLGPRDYSNNILHIIENNSRNNAAKHTRRLESSGAVLKNFISHTHVIGSSGHEKAFNTKFYFNNF